MTVLWFSLSPGGSARRFSDERYAQGWMTAFEDVVKSDPSVDLHVAFISKKEKVSFEYEGVTYHPIFRSKKALLEDRLSSGRCGYKGYLPRMLDIVDECHPDLIHIHGTEECFGMICSHVGDIPVVFSLQGLINPYIGKFFSGLSYRQILAHESLALKLTMQGVRNQFIKFRHAGEREAVFLSGASHVIGRTVWDRNVARLFNPSVTYHVVNEPLRRPFYERKWYKEGFSPVLRIVSTISGGYYKGFETLLKSADLLCRAGLEFEWSVIGLGEKDEIVRISEKVTHLGAHDVNVNLLGRKNAAQMAEILASSDVFCLVSHIENSPNSLCEAMLVGLPCVAADVGGTSSMLDHGREGLLVQDGDPYALAGAVMHLGTHFREAYEMAAAARLRAMGRHDYDNIRAELLGTYRDILSQSGS